MFVELFINGEYLDCNHRYISEKLLKTIGIHHFRFLSRKMCLSTCYIAYLFHYLIERVGKHTPVS